MTVLGGNETFAADVNALDPDWVTIAPTFSTASGSPTIGTGGGAALTSRYQKTDNRCTVSGYLKFGSSGASAGTGEFRISLPFAAATVTDQAWVGEVYINDTSAGASGHFHGVCMVLSGGTYLLFYAGNAGAQVTNAAPMSWASGDSFRYEITYEPA